jgi:hypothetical protein
MEVYIYGLKDPITNEVRYVGKTIQPLNKRLSQHLWEGNNSNPYKLNWINQVKSKGCSPEIILLEVTTESEWVLREQYWISQYDRLTNLTDGGESGLYFTEEILNKISEGVKTAWQDDEYRNNQLTKQKEYWSDPENRKKASERMKGRCTYDDRTTTINMKLEQWKDDEYRTMMSKQSRELWEDEEYKKKVLGYLQSDEHKKKVSERFKGKKKSDECRANMSKSNKNKKPIVIDGVEYESITAASKKLDMNRDKLRGRLKSKHFNNYTYKN